MSTQEERNARKEIHRVNQSLGIEERHGSATFYDLLERMGITHDKKSHDYASNDNPYGNYHFAGQISSMFAHSPQDAGFAGRLAEKIYRLANLESSGKTAKNESVDDTEIDIAVITALWMADRIDRRLEKNRMELNKFVDTGRSLRATLMAATPHFTPTDIEYLYNFFAELYKRGMPPSPVLSETKQDRPK